MIPGDVNGDEVIDIYDLAVYATGYLVLQHTVFAQEPHDMRLVENQYKAVLAGF